MSKRRPVVCAISGGVDSAVSLLRLVKDPDFEVPTALFMKNWDAREELNSMDRCPSDKDEAYARQVCDRLGVNLHIADFSKDYWNEVFTTMIAKYKAGLTPNPDILCNKYIKFGSLRNYIDLFFGPDHYIATGHYGKTAVDWKGMTSLLIPLDKVKDQTFFLSQIRQKALQKTVFPLANLLKFKVKQIANENNLGFVNERKESMGLCFVGDRKFNHFLRDYIPVRRGPVVDFETGKIVGQHEGVHFYTTGQSFLLPYIQKCRSEVFVYKRDSKQNVLFVVQGRTNPLLWQCFFKMSSFNWISGRRPTELLNSNILLCQSRMQHGYPLINCDVRIASLCDDERSDIIDVELHGRSWAVTPGQFSVLYKNGVCLGSGEILPFDENL